jgi:putative redox protein
MITSKITYLGDLRTRCEHIRSGQTFITDAPVDNNGKGEAFSPTDLTATSLGTCMVTIMGISANNHGLSIEGTELEVTKIMSSAPRKIAEIAIKLTMPANNFTEKDKKLLEAAARTCPVALSLHPDIKQSITFIWP